MFPFFLLIFVPLIIQHVKIKNVDYRKKNKVALSVFFVMLFVLLAFRNSCVGNDTLNYMNFFDRINWLGPYGAGLFADEQGFLIYTWLVSLVTDNPQVYIAISSLLIVVLMLPTYLRLSEDTSLTVAIFCSLSTFVMMFSGIRQMLVISLGFVVYHFVRKKKIIPFLLVALIAVLFHTSAIMLFIMYPLYHVKITKKSLWVIIPTIIVIFIFNEQIFSAIGGYIETYTRFDSSIEETGAYAMIVLFALLSIFCFIVPDESRIDKETVGLRNFLLFAMVIQFFAPLHTLAMRIGYYFIIFIPLLIPRIIKFRSKRVGNNGIYIRHLMVVLFIAYFLYTMYISQPLHVSPYHFCWEVV